MKKNKITFHNKEMIIEDNNHIVRIMYKDIVSIVCDAPYLKIDNMNGKNLFIYYCLEEMINNLPSIFVLCNRSVIINLLYADSLQCKFFVLKTGKQIPIARRKRKELKEKWGNFDRSPY